MYRETKPPSTSIKVAFVVQRYGKTIIGGSEKLVSNYAKKLSEHLDWSIDIYTTTADNYLTWHHTFPVGKEKETNKITIFRYRPSRQKNTTIFRAYKFIMTPVANWLRKWKISRKIAQFIEVIWINLQGPVCPKLLIDLKENEHQYQKIFFFTYLYWPTIWGLSAFPNKAVVVPTAHDESPFYFSIVGNSLRCASHILAISHSELLLLKERLPTCHDRIHLVGVGLESWCLEPLNPFKSINQNYLLYLGRISKGKNVHQLISWYLNFMASSSSILPLVIAGKKDEHFSIVENENIRFMGQVSEKERQRLIQGASCVINPSLFESLSLIVIEALAAGTPVLVNHHCPILQFYSSQSPIVFSYQTKEEFKTQLSKILALEKRGDWLEQSRIQSKEWAINEFKWSRVYHVMQSTISSSHP